MNGPFQSLALLAAVIVVVGMCHGAAAAGIELTDNPNCVVRLDGEIQSGDFDKFVRTAQQALLAEREVYDGRGLICLNSPGGNLKEGVKFARYIFSGQVGTVVDAGDSCFSSCAIMFMMGSPRRLDATGRLGFHRPYIKPAAGDGSQLPETLAASYDQALASALDLILLANSRLQYTFDAMMKPDLIQEMLAHVGNDMFMIDTVDKVGRWGIELVGIEQPTLLTEEQAFYACQNMLQWQTGVTVGDITYTDKVARHGEEFPRVAQFATPAGSFAYRVENLHNDSAFAMCVISSDGIQLNGCGSDWNTMAVVGKLECNEQNYVTDSRSLDPLVVFNPNTPIVSLAKH